jgi:hypothetical protein
VDRQREHNANQIYYLNPSERRKLFNLKRINPAMAIPVNLRIVEMGVGLICFYSGVLLIINAEKG